VKHFGLKLYVKVQICAADFKARMEEECGQDLIEYALTAALIALGATVAMTSVASNISKAFSNVSSKLITASS